jgi:hypothetical protein
VRNRENILVNEVLLLDSPFPSTPVFDGAIELSTGAGGGGGSGATTLTPNSIAKADSFNSVSPTL